MNSPSGSSSFGMHIFTQMERIYWGRPVREALNDELALTKTGRVFVITNRSLSKSLALETVINTLGERFVGMYDGVAAHTPRNCVIEGACAARALTPDILLAVGGGSVVDASKAMLLCMRHGYSSVSDLDPHANIRTPERGVRPADADQWTRLVCIPTTLSGAEFASSAGLTDPRRMVKEAFVNSMQMPRAVILDPDMTLSTPIELLKSTGMKAVDHAVERMTSSTATSYSNAVSALALELLAPALRQLEESPASLEIRSQLQYGMFMSLCGSASGAAVNVSHSIGHVLGGHAKVPHGQTTGLILPSVLRWMQGDIQSVSKRIATALGNKTTTADPAEEVVQLARNLGLPTRLRDVGLKRDDLPELAKKTMHEALLRNSPKPVQGESDVMKILDMAW